MKRLPQPRDVLRNPTARWVAAACVGGAMVRANPLSPTGAPVADVVVVMALCMLWVAAASAAPVPVLVAAGVVATALTGDPWAVGIGLALMALGWLWRPGAGEARSPTQHLHGAVLAAGVGQLLARIRPLGAFGASTLLALLLAGAVLVLGWRRHDPAVRRVLRRTSWAVAGTAVVCSATFGITTATAASDLISGGRAARAALRLADAGDLDAALASFNDAATRLQRADRSLDAWWGVPGRAVPLVSQQQRALQTLADDAAAASSTIAEILSRTDYDALGVVEGRIDLDAIRALDAPISELEAALEDLGDRIDDVETDWLAPPITNLVHELADDVDSKQAQLLDVQAALDVAPDMLGASGPRTYFIALTTPAEARGVGGLMGNWAEITVDRGRLELTGFGRHQELLEAATTLPRLTGMPEEYLAQYGAYVLGDADALTIGPGVWPNLTVPAHFPWVAEAIASLYPQSGGRPLDGVFLMDVYTVSTLMRLTGPVVVPELGVEVTPESALSYLLRDQYLVTDLDARVDLLETLARTTIDRILDGALPPPPQLAALLRPLVQQHRLAAWATRAPEQQVLRNANMTKELEAEPASHVFAYTLYNSNGNKIDAYLDASADYAVADDPETGAQAGTFTIRLRNTAPSSGLPDYVIGNLVDLPTGTNRMILTVLSSSPVRSMTTDAGNPSWITGSERGLSTASTTIELPPGGEIVLTISLGGAAPGALPNADGTQSVEEEAVVIDLPPTANPIPFTVRVDGRVRTPEPIAVSGRFAFDR